MDVRVDIEIVVVVVVLSMLNGIKSSLSWERYDLYTC